MSYPQAITTRLDTQWGIDRAEPYRVPLYGDAIYQLCNRARNLERRNGLARAALDRCVENVVGTGIELRPTSSDPAYNAAIKRLWRDITQGKKFDVRRMLTWLDIQRHIVRSALRDGDVGVLLVDEGNGPELQLVGMTSIATPPSSGNRAIRDGVELDTRGRPVAYWVRTYSDLGVESFQRVEARDMILYHRSPRHDVVRGESAFNGGFTKFEQIDGLIDATVVGQRVAASACVIRKRKVRRTGFEAPGADRTPNADGVLTSAVSLEPGSIIDIPADDDIQTFTPAPAGSNFAETLRAIGRFTGLAFGLTIQRILLDFSQTNYSVSRSTALQEQRFVEPEQRNFVESVLRRLYQWTVSKWIKAGLVRDEAGNLIEPPDDSWSFEWIPPSRPLVEPSKDAPGQKVMIDMNVESYRNVAESNGYDLDQIISDNAADLAKMRAAGIDPHMVAQAITAKPEDDDSPNNPAKDDEEQ